jgi:hypothetical protein
MSLLPTFTGVIGPSPSSRAPNADATTSTHAEPLPEVVNEQAIGTSAPIPTHVREYNELVVRIKQQRARLHELAPTVTAYIASLPSQSYDFGDGKIRLTSSVVRSAVTESFVRKSIQEVLQRSDPRCSETERKRIAKTMSQYIWQQRSARTNTRLDRTWSRKRKCRVEDLAPAAASARVRR